MVTNLLGHFSDWQVHWVGLRSYQAGALSSCRAAIFIGSDFYETPSDVFLTDWYAYQGRSLWMGYGAWHDPESFARRFGHQAVRVASADGPHFFRDVWYKGERFQKFLERSSTGWTAHDELTVLAPLSGPTSAARSLAVIEHNLTGERRPYILEADGHYFVSDLPLTFIHESDRYLVFADVLFDVLQEPPQERTRRGLIRLEDLHPRLDLRGLASSLQVLESHRVPALLSVIPIYQDSRESQDLADPRSADFLQLLRRAIDSQGHRIAWHGVTHQTDGLVNPHSGVSGDDDEFWDSVRNRPLPQDSEAHWQDRLDRGASVFQRVGLPWLIWLTPHYQASYRAASVFVRRFGLMVGRASYSLDSRDQVRFGQFYPYRIARDSMGQMIWPENLGNVQPEINSQVQRRRLVEQILEDARRNRVLRDTWGSVFFHTHLSPSELDRLVGGLKSLGYDFDWLRTVSN
jgi:uncharacterized protein YdaL